MNYEQSAAIGALLNTTSKNKPLAHQLKVLPFAAPRAAFLGLIRLNIWGLATLMKKQMFLVDKATTDASKMGQYYWDIYQRWDIGWYNLGGNMNSLVNAINAGHSKRPLGIKLAPKSLRDKLAAKGISGVDPQGIGSIEAGIATAMIVITPLIPLIMQLINNVVGKNNKSGDTYDDFTIPPPTDSGISPGMMGAGLVGVALLAALYIGTKKK